VKASFTTREQRERKKKVEAFKAKRRDMSKLRSADD
jgi:hypothetical protein